MAHFRVGGSLSAPTEAGERFVAVYQRYFTYRLQWQFICAATNTGGSSERHPPSFGVRSLLRRHKCMHVKLYRNMFPSTPGRVGEGRRATDAPPLIRSFVV